RGVCGPVRAAEKAGAGPCRGQEVGGGPDLRRLPLAAGDGGRRAQAGGPPPRAGPQQG
ncbi:unnamed protein product, partial [Heterosigma akashiwo]